MGGDKTEKSHVWTPTFFCCFSSIARKILIYRLGSPKSLQMEKTRWNQSFLYKWSESNTLSFHDHCHLCRSQPTSHTVLPGIPILHWVIHNPSKPEAVITDECVSVILFPITCWNIWHMNHDQVPIAVGSSCNLCTQYAVATTNIYPKTWKQNCAWKPFNENSKTCCYSVVELWKPWIFPVV